MTITILTSSRHSPVTSPPNGFAGAEYGVSSLVPISARVYRALTGSEVQFTPAAGVADVEDVIVEYGTSEIDAISALPATTTLTDIDGGEWDVALTWQLPNFDGTSPGDYEAIGSFELPDGITPGDPAIATEVRTMVTVAEQVTKTVEPVAPTFVDEPGTVADTYTIPEVEGVQYMVNGEQVESGTYPGIGDVTITAVPEELFEFANDAVAQWSHTFEAGPTEEPTDKPTEEPTDKPTEEPTDKPTEEPTDKPTDKPADEAGSDDGLATDRLPKTGANITGAGIAALILLLIGGAVVLMGRRNRLN